MNANLKKLRARLHALDEERSRIGTQVHLLETEEARARYTCTCVVYNEDVWIFDMGDQERAGRRGLDVGGLVAKTFSADKSCRICGGHGIPPYDPADRADEAES